MTRKVACGLGLAAISAVLWSASTIAQQPQTPAASCPAGYWQLDLLCLNNTNGDVVLAEPPASPRATYEAGCRPGYWRLGDLCQSSATGDVELVDDERWRPGPTGSQAE